MPLNTFNNNNLTIPALNRLFVSMLLPGVQIFRPSSPGHKWPLRSTACAVAAPEAPGSINPPTYTTENRQGPVVVVDNYDSFTYNLCQYLGDLGCEHVVFRNDEISVAELQEMAPRGILISPGPGTPEDSGISLQTVRELGPSVPLFGVCMGLQCIGQAFGGEPKQGVGLEVCSCEVAWATASVSISTCVVTCGLCRFFRWTKHKAFQVLGRLVRHKA